jgi:hypothetical protein
MIRYEWTLEEIKDGEIIDADFSDTLSFDKENLKGNDLGLVMNEGNEKEGLTNRLWAYVKNGSLPQFFSDSTGEETKYKVPVKFQKELKKYLQLIRSK